MRHRGLIGSRSIWEVAEVDGAEAGKGLSCAAWFSRCVVSRNARQSFSL